MTMKTRKALVAGASGTVGRALALALVESGWAVHGLARFSNPAVREELEAAGVITHPFDITRDDPAGLPEAEVVFLEIWDPRCRPERLWPLNFYGIGRLVEAYAGRADFVNGCTIAVYGKSASQPDEASPCRPFGEYDRVRYAQERLIDYFCHVSGSRGIHLRYAHANSSGAGLLHRLCRQIIEETPFEEGPGERFQVIALEDFIRVTIAASDHLSDPPALLNCCHPRVWTLQELAGELHRRLGRGSVRFIRPSGGAEDSYIADPQRMIDLLGLPRVPLETVLERVVERYR